MPHSSQNEGKSYWLEKKISNYSICEIIFFFNNARKHWALKNMFLKNIFRILCFLLCCEWTKEWFKGFDSFLYCDVLYTTCVYSEFTEIYSCIEKDHRYHMKINLNCLDVVRSYCHFINRDEALSSYIFRNRKIFLYCAKDSKLIKLLLSRYFNRYFYMIT